MPSLTVPQQLIRRIVPLKASSIPIIFILNPTIKYNRTLLPKIQLLPASHKNTNIPDPCTVPSHDLAWPCKLLQTILHSQEKESKEPGWFWSQSFPCMVWMGKVLLHSRDYIREAAGDAPNTGQQYRQGLTHPPFSSSSQQWNNLNFTVCHR